jgi:hypothetical protein
MNDTIMMSQYIYLLQEREFIKTKENVYKVGMTKKENHERFNQYPKGSVLLFQIICNNCKNMEKIVLTKFKETFKQRKDIGNEYFEGEYKVMIDIIYLTIKDELNINEEIINDEEATINTEEEQEQEQEDDDDKDEQQENKIKFNLLCEKICKIFPDYKNDESFGGNKKYIKISIIDNEYVVYYINSELMDYLNYYYETECETRFNDYIINQYEINKNVADSLQYFNHLINKKLVCLDKIYDIYSTGFITKINKTKFYINIENYDDFQIHLTNNKFYCKITEKIRQLFHCNTIVNTSLYSTMVKEDETYDIFKKFKNLKDYDNFRIDVGIQDYNMIKLYKINSKYYDYKTFLRKYIPYLIRWDDINNYYIVNRDYEYIGLNSKSIDYTEKGESYLFNDGNKPWDNMNNYIRFCNEYKKIIKDNSLKSCLNMHNSTATTLILLD